MSKVKVIEANKDLNSYGRVKVVQKRVAPYCRVSTDSSEQKLSYNSQVMHYRELVESNPDWKLVEIYADEGITIMCTLVKTRNSSSVVMNSFLD